MTTTYREATSADTRTLYDVSERATADFARRQGYPWEADPADAALWRKRQPMFEHLAATAERCWLAELDGEAIGYARSVMHDGTRELTEFFVLPGRQSAGVGGELLRRAFPAEGAARRLIVATSELRALARYMKAGVYARCPIFDFRRAPEAVTYASDLMFEPIAEPGTVRETLAAIDKAVLGYRKDSDHAWLASQRAGFVARRGGEAVGYGYVGEDSGPFAALRAQDLAALLAHAETLAHARGVTDLGFEVPLVNRVAVDYLLGRGYKLQAFFAFLMSDSPWGRFENYVLFSPPYFV